MKPSKRFFILSFGCMLAATLIVFILVATSLNNRSEPGGFTRTFIPKAVVLLYQSENVKGLRNICGIENDHIYFETGTVGSIIETDSTLSNKSLLKFTIPETGKVQSLYTTFVDSSYCYIMAGNVPAIIRYNLKETSWQSFHFPGNLFSQAIVTKNGNYVLREYKKTNGGWNQGFTKWNPEKSTFIIQQPITGEKGDAGFSTDGILLFDKTACRILYVSYYSNQFLCFDTLMNVLYKGHTIDTFSNTKVKVLQELNHYSRSFTNATPLQLISLEGKAVNSKLFIHSGIRADNETFKDFEDHDVIDMYDISNGQYIKSFYIPIYNKERLKDFDVTGDKIIVLYSDRIMMYSIPFNR